MPGAYQYKDFLEESAKKLQTFSFKTVDRENIIKIGHGYGDKVCVGVCVCMHACLLSVSPLLPLPLHLSGNGDFTKPIQCC